MAQRGKVQRGGFYAKFGGNDSIGEWLYVEFRNDSIAYNFTNKNNIIIRTLNTQSKNSFDMKLKVVEDKGWKMRLKYFYIFYDVMCVDSALMLVKVTTPNPRAGAFFFLEKVENDGHE